MVLSCNSQGNIKLPGRTQASLLKQGYLPNMADIRMARQEEALKRFPGNPFFDIGGFVTVHLFN